MTRFTIGGWLLVALAIIGLAVAAPVVSAHGTDATADDAPPYEGPTDHRTGWMEGHATGHAGPDGVGWTESRTGVTVGEMARYMTGGGHGGGMYGQGHCRGR